MTKQFELTFYICTICFRTSEREEECHTLMMPIDGASLKDKQRKPLEENGRLITHAPQWFLTASKKNSEQ